MPEDKVEKRASDKTTSPAASNGLDITELYKQMSRADRPTGKADQATFKRIDESRIDGGFGRIFTKTDDRGWTLEIAGKSFAVNNVALTPDGSLTYTLGSNDKTTVVTERRNGTKSVRTGTSILEYNANFEPTGTPPSEPTTKSSGDQQFVKADVPAQTEKPADPLAKKRAEILADWESKHGEILKELRTADKGQKDLYHVLSERVKKLGLEAQGWKVLSSQYHSPLDKCGGDYVLVNTRTGEVHLLDATTNTSKAGDPLKHNVAQIRQGGLIEFKKELIDQSGSIVDTQEGQDFSQRLDRQLKDLAAKPSLITLDMLPPFERTKNPADNPVEIQKYQDRLDEKAKASQGRDAFELRQYADVLQRAITYEQKNAQTVSSPGLKSKVQDRANSVVFDYLLKIADGKTPVPAQPKEIEGLKLYKGKLQVELGDQIYDGGNVQDALTEARRQFKCDPDFVLEHVKREFKGRKTDKEMADLAKRITAAAFNSEEIETGQKGGEKLNLDVAVKLKLARLNGAEMTEVCTGKKSAAPQQDIKTTEKTTPKSVEPAQPQPATDSTKAVAKPKAADVFTPAESAELTKIAKEMENWKVVVKDGLKADEMEIFMKIHHDSDSTSPTGKAICKRYLEELAKPAPDRTFVARVNGALVSALEQSAKSVDAATTNAPPETKENKEPARPEGNKSSAERPLDTIVSHKALINDQVIQSFDSKIRELMPELQGSAKDVNAQLKKALQDHISANGGKDGIFALLNVEVDKTAKEPRTEYFSAKDGKPLKRVAVTEFRTHDDKPVELKDLRLRIVVPEAMLHGSSTPLAKALYGGALQMTAFSTDPTDLNAIRSHVDESMDKGAAATKAPSKQDAPGLNQDKLPEAAEKAAPKMSPEAQRMHASSEALIEEFNRRLVEESAKGAKGDKVLIGKLTALIKHEEGIRDVLSQPGHADHSLYVKRAQERAVELETKMREIAEKHAAAHRLSDSVRGKVVPVVGIATFLLSMELAK